MKRRKMIGQMAILTVGLPFVPGFLRASHNNLSNIIPDNTLDAVIDVIIPEGKTPGAISLGVSDYVKIMLLDGVSKEQKNAADTALKFLEKKTITVFNKPFISCDMEGRVQIWRNAIATASEIEKTGLNLLKSLTIKGYQTSSYFMKQVIPYEMAPNRYNGCVTIK
jgi:hypothetical protein